MSSPNRGYFSNERSGFTNFRPLKKNEKLSVPRLFSFKDALSQGVQSICGKVRAQLKGPVQVAEHSLEHGGKLWNSGIFSVYDGISWETMWELWENVENDGKMMVIPHE